MDDLPAALTEALLEFFRRALPSLIVLRAPAIPTEELPMPIAPPLPVALRRAREGWLTAAVAEPDAIAEALLGTIEARCFHAYLGGATSVPGSDRAFIERLVAALSSLPRGTP